MTLRSRILSPFVVALFLLLTLPTAWPGEGPGPVLAAGAGEGYLVPGLILLGAASLIDPSLYETVQESSTPERRAFFDAVTYLGDGWTAVAVALGLRGRDPRTADMVGTAFLRAGLAVNVLKLVVSRPRPTEDPAKCGKYGWGLSHCGSFPSGHSATAFSVAHVLAHRYPEHKGLFYTLALLAAWSRVEVQAHWPSDVVAGALIGLLAADSVINQASGR